MMPLSLRGFLLPLLVVLALDAERSYGRMIEHRAVIYTNQTSPGTTTTSSATTSSVALPSTGSPTVTLPGTGTSSVTLPGTGISSTTSSSITAAANASTYDCCYLIGSFVHINTWYSKQPALYVADVVTTWYQYNDTLIPYTSNTVQLTDVATFYGTYGGLGVSAGGGSVTAYSSPNWTTTYTTTETFTYSTSTDIETWTVTDNSYVKVTIPTNIPSTLITQQELGYAESIIDNKTSTVFPAQDLTIYSPTPYIVFRDIGVITNGNSVCPTPRTEVLTTLVSVTSGVSEFVTTQVVTPTYSGTTLNPTDIMPFPGADYADTEVSGTFVVPIPTNYPGFNLSEWMSIIGAGGVDSGVEFAMPNFIPGYLAQIPAIRSNFSNIGQCTPGAANGEPTVHIPVTELTSVSHTTVTVNGNFNTASKKQTTSSPPTQKSTTPSPSPTVVSPTPSPTVATTSHTSTPSPESTVNSNTKPSSTAETQPSNSQATSSPEQSTKSTQSEAATSPQSNPETSQQHTESSQTVIHSTSNGGNSPSQQSPSTQAQQSPSTQAQQTQTTGGSAVGAPSPSQQSPSTQAQQTQTSGGSAGGAPSPSVPESSSSSTGLGQIIASVLGLTTSTTSAAHTETTGGGVVTSQNVQSEASTGSGPSLASQPASAQVTSEVTIGGQTATISRTGSDVVVGTQTLHPSQAITVNGQTLSLESSGAVVAGDSTVAGGAPASASNGNSEGAVSLASVPTASPAQITVGSQVVGISQAGTNVIVGTETLRPNHDVTVNGETISLGSSGAVVAAGSTVATVSVPENQPTTVATLGGETIAISGTGSTVVIGSQTLVKGSTIVVAGQTLSIASGGSGVVAISSGVAEQTIGLGSSPPQETGLLTLAGSTYTYTKSGSDIIVGSQTIAPGAAITEAGETLSLAQGGSAIVAVSGTVASTVGIAPEVTAGLGTLSGSGLTYSKSGSEIIVGSQTLAPGSVITVSGEALSIAPGGTGIVAVSGTVTSTIGIGNPTTFASGVTGLATLGGSTLTYSKSGSDIIVGSQTLAPGSVITVSGETLSLASEGTGIVAVSGSVTSTVGIAGGTTPTPEATGLATLGDSTLTYIRSGSDIIVGSQTLEPGSVITVSGETLSIATGGSTIVAVSGSQTLDISVAASPSSGSTSTGTSSVGTNVGHHIGQTRYTKHFYATFVFSAIVFFLA